MNEQQNTNPTPTPQPSFWDKIKGPIAFIAIGYFAGMMTAAFTKRKMLS